MADDSPPKELNAQLYHLSHQLQIYSKWFQPVRTVAGIMSRLEDELSNKAQNARVNVLENRLRHFEEKSEKITGSIDNGIKENKVKIDTQIEKVMETVCHVVDKLATAVKQLQDQVREEKQVTDWVKKEYKLQTVQKVR